MQIKVRALPVPGNKYRRRAGLAFDESYTTLEVVEQLPKDFDPAKDKLPTGKITALQLAELQGDRRLTVIPDGADEAVAADAAAKVAISDSALAKAKKELAAAHELADENRRAGEKAAKEAADKIAKLEAENEDLRAKLAKASAKK
jgi:hypothetical protein